MSIRDYNQKLILINGLTNEQVKIPQYDEFCYVDERLTLNDYFLLKTIKENLKLAETVTVCKTYMKD